MKKIMGVVTAVILSLSLMASPAYAKGSSGGGGHAASSSHSSSGSSSSKSSSSGSSGKSVTPPKASSAPSNNSSGKSVTPPKSTGGAATTSSKTATSGKSAPKATTANNNSYFSSAGGSVASKSGNRVTGYNYTDPVTHSVTVYHYYPPTYYNSHPGFITGLGAGFLLDRFYGPNYTNASSPLYNQGTPPGYYISNGNLIAYHHHSVIGTIFAWFFTILFFILVAILIIWLYRKYKKSKQQLDSDEPTPGSYGRDF